MLRWFGKTACPVKIEIHDWIAKRSRWIIETFSADRVSSARVILPTPEFFPDAYDATEIAGEKLFDRMCDYAGIARDRLQLHWVTGKHVDRGGPLFIKSEGGAAGTFLNARKPIVTLDRANLPTPMILAATIAHELCHVHLLADARIAGDEEDHEPLTDLLTVFLGIGIFGANAAVSDSTWSDSRMSGWRVSRLGYLSQATWGHARHIHASEK